MATGAGATGSGKSVCINAIITSLIYAHGPDKLKLLMIDPKMVELSMYSALPHLGLPVVTSHHKAANVLKWAVWEMERRYRLLHANHARAEPFRNFNRAVGRTVVRDDNFSTQTGNLKRFQRLFNAKRQRVRFVQARDNDRHINGQGFAAHVQCRHHFCFNRWRTVYCQVPCLLLHATPLRDFRLAFCRPPIMMTGFRALL